MNIKRHNNESFISYFKRVIQLARDKRISYIEMNDLLFGQDNVYSSDNCRKMFYGFDKLAEKFEDDVLVTDDELLAEIQKQKEELYKERCRNQDLNRERNKSLREEARFEKLLEVLSEEILLLEPIQIQEFKEIESKKKKYAVAQFSDWHALKLIDNQWNIYNQDVMIERAYNIANKIINKSVINKVTDLIIEINGDMIDGLIQVSSRNVEESDVIRQIVFVSELLSQIVNKLKPYYKSIKIVTTLGNHGRLFESKKLGTTKENFEMLIPEFMKLRLGTDIPIIKSHGLDFTSYEIEGDLICVAHGQNDKLSTVIADFAKMYKRVPREIHLGHTHSYKDINDCDIYVTVNGSLCGSDDYSINNCRKVTRPSQNFIIYDNDDRCIYSLSAE